MPFIREKYLTWAEYITKAERGELDKENLVNVYKSLNKMNLSFELSCCMSNISRVLMDKYHLAPEEVEKIEIEALEETKRNGE